MMDMEHPEKEVFSGEEVEKFSPELRARWLGLQRCDFYHTRSQMYLKNARKLFLEVWLKEMEGEFDNVS